MTTFQLKRGGDEIEIRLVSSFRMAKVRDAVRKEFAEKEGEGTPPTYTVVLGGGPFGEAGTETHDYTADSIEQGADEDKAAWAEYQRLQRGLAAELWARTSEIYLYRGIVPDPPNDGWDDEQREDGIEIPDDPRKYKVHWIETELLANNQELFNLIAAIQGKVNEVDEAAKVAASMFPD